MSLFIGSHYKNTPNDLQLLSDAPAHAVFVLLGPLEDSQGKGVSIPEVLCAIQVSFEGSVKVETKE
jgi:N-acetyltransferase 10